MKTKTVEELEAEIRNPQAFASRLVSEFGDLTNEKLFQIFKQSNQDKV